MRVKTMIMALAMTLTSVAGFAQNAKSVNLTFGVMYPQTVDATFVLRGRHSPPQCLGVLCQCRFQVERLRLLRPYLCGILLEGQPYLGLGCSLQTLRLSHTQLLRQPAPWRLYRLRYPQCVRGVHAGYEHNYSLKGGWRLFWQVKCDCMIKGDDLFRTGVTIGVKIPTSSTR